MKDNTEHFFGGLIGGFLIAAIFNSTPWSDAGLYYKAKQECERTLPRNQECKVIGVVK